MPTNDNLGKQAPATYLRELDGKYKFNPRVLDAVDSTDVKIRECIAHFQEKKEAVSISRRLEDAFWKVIDIIVRNVIYSKRSEDQLVFNEEEVRIINFGLFEKRFIPDLSAFEATTARLAEEFAGAEFGCTMLSEFFVEKYKAGLSLDVKDGKLGRVEALSRELATFEAALRMKRDDRTAYYATHNSGKQLTALSEKIDLLVPKIAMLNDRIHRRAAKATPQDRREFGRLNETLAKLRVEEEHLLRADPSGRGKIVKTQAQLLQLMIKIARLQEEKDAVLSSIADADAGRDALTAATRVGKISAEIEKVKKWTKAFSRGGRIKPWIMLHTAKEFVTADRIHAVIEKMRAHDKRLLQKLKDGFWEMPSVKIFPSTGESFYDFTTRSVWMPLVPYQKVDEAIVSGFADFRFQRDLTNMVENYGSLPDCQGLKTQRAVRRKFIKDYTSWLLFDVDGFRRLNAALTRWFQQHIATPEKKKGKKKDEEEAKEVVPEGLDPDAEDSDDEKEDRKKGIINF